MKSLPCEGFTLDYDRAGTGPAVVLLHGWPGDRHDYDAVVPLLAAAHDVVVPDLRGFGASSKPLVDPAQHYGAAGQARSIVALIEELGLARVVLAGYDVGSRIAQAVARARPDLVQALVVAPPLPGIGQRILEPQVQAEFWYQSFHRSPLIERVLDGDARAVREYLAYIWGHWSGPGYAVEAARFERLVEAYSAPGAFTASIAWYRAGSGAVAMSLAESVPAPEARLAIPTTVLWPEHDKLFPRAWSDRLGEFFRDVALVPLDGIGHFVPLEAPGAFAEAVAKRGIT